MNDERCDRDRVTAILTLAAAAETHGVSEGDLEAWATFYANCRTEVPWLGELALEALDTIDRLEGENARLRGAVLAGDIHQRVQGLNGGNE